MAIVKKKGEIIMKNVIDRRKGYLYYFDKDGNVVETPMNKKGGIFGRTVPRKNKCTKSK